MTRRKWRRRRGRRMLGAHVRDSFLRVEIKAVGDKGFRSLAVLALLSKQGGAANVSGDFRRRRFSTRAASGLMPQIIEAAIEEGADPLFDSSRLLLKTLLPRRDEEDEFEVGEGLDPVVDVVRIPENVPPDGVLKRRQLTPRRLGDVAENGDASRKYVVQCEGKRSRSSNHRLRRLAREKTIGRGVNAGVRRIRRRDDDAPLIRRRGS